MATEEPGIKVARVAGEDASWRRAFKAFYADCPRPDRRGAEHAYFAAWAGRKLAGHSEIYFDGERWVMDGLRVAAEFRERGIAKRLTAARIRYATERGAKEIWYACDDGNLVTICCHLRFGFKKVCPAGHSCNAATAHWYRLKVTKKLLRDLESLAPA
ncbi:MAG: GNAT family N-acetyltransferase [Elusimicrobiales bacterium]|jgi:L-amino acid N-acyltransferase YncA|nr:GNAT family N-acetyltransferase [Elusimicrobiales bacterium]